MPSSTFGSATRRDFLAAGALAGSSLWLPRSARATSAPRRPRGAADKLNVACIGCGGKGFRDLQGVAGENVVALCDVDEKRAARGFKLKPDARRYHDFREMLENERSLDAVTISTPDHTHAAAAAMAMQMGLHVFCQKPLTHSVHEARVLRELAARHGVATQMGNQGNAASGLRRGAEIVRSGALGDVREVHVWTNRPVWPQGIAAPEEIQPIPATMRWDLWLGPAPHRPYHKAYAPFSWRGWWDFGTGALGDMACHTFNLPYLALELGAPTSVEAECEGNSADSPPKWSVIRYEFPARGERPPVKLTWYDGGKKPPADALAGVELAPRGSLMIGSKGSLYAPGDYGTSFSLHPTEKFAGFEDPPQTLPRVENLYVEWLAACKGGPPAMSNFGYSGPLTETVLLGNVALRAGEKISWDAESGATSSDVANRYLQRDYRYGYSLG